MSQTVLQDNLATLHKSIDDRLRRLEQSNFQAITGPLEFAEPGGAPDSNIYRSGLATLKTDGNFVVAGNLTVLGTTTTTATNTTAGNYTARQGLAAQTSIGDVGPGSTAGISAGLTNPAVWYRAAADTWRTPDHVIMDADLTVGGNAAFSGVPTAPTAAVDTNTNQIATTSYVVGQGYLKASQAAATYAPLASPSFTGNVTVPSASRVGASDDYSIRFSQAADGAYVSIRSNGSIYANLDVGNNDSDSRFFKITKNAYDASATDLFTFSESGLATFAGTAASGPSLLLSSGWHEVRQPAATDWAFIARVTGSTNAEFAIRTDGLMQWGPGGTTGRDTNLYRGEADVLRTDDAFYSASNIRAGTYLRVGSTSTPANTTAGDISATRLSLGGLTLATGQAFAFWVNNTNTGSGAVQGFSGTVEINPAATSLTEFRSFLMSATVGTTNAQTMNIVRGVFAEARMQGTGSITEATGVYSQVAIPGAGQNFGTIANASAILANPITEFATTPLTAGTITTAVGVRVATGSKTSAGLTIGTLVGVDVASQTIGGTNIGVRIYKANTYTLQLPSTDGTAASGIWWGTDTNLYRSAASTLRTDDAFISNVSIAAQDDTNGYFVRQWPAGWMETKGASSGSWTLATMVAGDTQRRFVLTQNGAMTWGDGTNATDVNLYRSAANVLATDDRFTATASVGGAIITAKQLGSSYAHTSGIFEAVSNNTTAVQRAFRTMRGASGSEVEVFKIWMDGKQEWGAGDGTALDTNLYRGGVDVLRTDDNLQVGGSVVNLTAGGVFEQNAAADGWASLMQSKAVGDAGIRFRIYTSGRLEWGDGTSSTRDTALYRSAAGLLRTDSAFMTVGNISAYVSTSDTSPQVTLGRNATTGGFISFGIGGATATDATLRRSEVATLRFDQTSVVIDNTLYFGSGKDTNLYRSGADLLKTDDSFQVGGSYIATSNGWISLQRSTAASQILIGQVTGDANPRFRIQADGKIEWGVGTALTDTNLYRNAADVLKTDDTFDALAYRVSGVALDSTHLSDAASIAHINAEETISGSWTFSTAPSLGSATATTQAVDTADTRVATTAFVINQGYLKIVDAATQAELDAHEADTTNIHGIVDTALLATLDTTQTFTGAKTFSSVITSAVNQGIEFPGSSANTWRIGNELGVSTGAFLIKRVAGTGSGTIRFADGSTTRLTFGVDTGNLDITGTYQKNGVQISTADLSDGANVAHINATETISGAWTFDQTLRVVGPGITFGSANDTNLYRSTANELKTDDAFIVGGYLTASAGLASTGDITFTNPGFGTSRKFIFQHTNDGGSIESREHSSDLYSMTFRVYDNPGSGDYFNWVHTNWAGGGGWDHEPMRFMGFQTYLRGTRHNIYGEIAISGNYWTSRGPTASEAYGGTTPTTAHMMQGSGTLTVTPNASGFTGSTNRFYWVEIDGAGTPNTFKWGVDTAYAVPQATAVPITGAAQTLDSGVTITFNTTTGGVVGARWTFTAWSGQSGKITWAGDTNLYRGAADQLKTDDAIYINNAAGLAINTAPNTNGLINLPSATTVATGGILWGTDTNLYRESTGVLATDSIFRSSGSIRGLGAVYAKYNVRGNVSIGSDNNGNIELGLDGANPGSQTPFIDFHYSPAGTWAGQDYNIRIINDADGRLRVSTHKSDGFATTQLTVTHDAGIQFPGATTSANALIIGGDANLYRVGADTLRTDDALQVGGNLDAYGRIGVDRTSGGSTAYQTWITGNTQVPFHILASGEIRWGSGTAAYDARVYRSGVATLAFDTRVHILRPASSDLAYSATVTGDTNSRFYITAEGRMHWGSGLVATDTSLYRLSAGTLYSPGVIQAGDRFAGTLEPGTQTAYPLVSQARIYATNNPGSGVYPFDVTGHLIYQTRTDSNRRDHIFATGNANTWEEQFRISYSTVTVPRALSVGTNLSVGGTITIQDTNLYRSAANILKTDDSFTVGAITAYTDFTNQGWFIDNSGYLGSTRSVDGGVLHFNVVGDTTARFRITSSGELAWGSGAASRDTNLYRNGVAILRTGGEFRADGRLVAAYGNAGAEVTIGSSNNQIVFGTDTNLYRSAANILRTDDMFQFAQQTTLSLGDSNTYGLTMREAANVNATFSVGSDNTDTYIQSWGTRPLRLNTQGNLVYIGSGLSIAGGLTLTTGTFSIPDGSLDAKALADGTITAAKVGFVFNGGNIMQNATAGTGTIDAATGTNIGSTVGWSTNAQASLSASTTVKLGVWNSFKVEVTGLTTSSYFQNLYNTATGRADAVPGVNYTASAFVMPAAAGRQYRISLYFYDETTNSLSTNISAYRSDLPVGQFTRISVSGVAPAGTTRAAMHVWQSNTGASVGDVYYVAGPQVEMSDLPTQFGPRASEILPGTIQATMLRSSIIDGDHIVASMLLQGKRIQTGASLTAPRIVIDGTTNTDGTNTGIEASRGLFIYGTGGTKRVALREATGALTNSFELFNTSGALGAFLSDTGGLMVGSQTGARVILDPTGLQAFDTTPTKRVQIDATTAALKLYDTGGNLRVQLSSAGGLETTGATGRVRFDDNGLIGYNSTTTFDATTQVVQIDRTTGKFIGGAPTATRVEIDRSGLRFFGGTTERVTLEQTDGLTLRDTAGTARIKLSTTGGLETTGATGRVRFDDNGLTAWNSITTFDTTTQVVQIDRASGKFIGGAPASTRVEIDRSGFRFYSSTIERVTLDQASGLTLRDTGGSAKVTLSTTGGLTTAAETGARAQFDATGVQMFNGASTRLVVLSPTTGLELKDNSGITRILLDNGGLITANENDGAVIMKGDGIWAYTSRTTRDATTQTFSLERTTGKLTLGVPNGARMEADRSSLRFFSTGTTQQFSVISGVLTTGAADSGTRVRIDSTGLKAFGAASTTVPTVHISSDGSLSLTGTGRIEANEIAFNIGGINLIPDSSFETSATGTWSNRGTEITISRTTAVSRTGSAAQMLTKPATFTANGSTSMHTTLRPVNQGEVWTYSAYVRSDSVPRNAYAGFRWAGGTGGATYHSDTTGTTVLTTTNGWTRVVVTATVPSNVSGGVTATHMQPYVAFGVVAAGEIHYVDDVQLELGGVVTEWSQYIDPTFIDNRTVTSGTIRTAASGARVEMDGTANSLAVYSTTQRRVQLDGTAGLTLYDTNGNPKVALSTTGGLRTGAETGARVEINETGLIGYSGASAMSVGIQTTTGKFVAGTSFTTGARMEADATSLRFYSASALQFSVIGGVLTTGATTGARVQIDSTGLKAFATGDDVNPTVRISNDGSLSLTGTGRIDANEISFRVGGNNLIENGAFEDPTLTVAGADTIGAGYWDAGVARTTTAGEFHTGTAAVRVTVPAADAHASHGYTGRRAVRYVDANMLVVASAMVKFPLGTTFIVSGRADTVDVESPGTAAEGMGQITYTGTGDWQWVRTSSFTRTGRFRPKIQITTTATAFVFYVDEVKIEEGEVATPFSQYLDPTFIDGRTITSGTIRTAATGARLEMNGTTNAFLAYNASGYKLVQLDGASGLQLFNGTSANVPSVVLSSTGGLTTSTGSGSRTIFDGDGVKTYNASNQLMVKVHGTDGIQLYDAGGNATLRMTAGRIDFLGAGGGNTYMDGSKIQLSSGASTYTTLKADGAIESAGGNGSSRLQGGEFYHWDSLGRQRVWIGQGSMSLTGIDGYAKIILTDTGGLRTYAAAGGPTVVFDGGGVTSYSHSSTWNNSTQIVKVDAATGKFIGGNPVGQRVEIDRDSMRFFDSNDVQGLTTAFGGLATSVSSTTSRTQLTTSGLEIYEGSTRVAQFNQTTGLELRPLTQAYPAPAVPARTVSWKETGWTGMLEGRRYTGGSVSHGIINIESTYGGLGSAADTSNIWISAKSPDNKAQGSMYAYGINDYSYAAIEGYIQTATATRRANLYVQTSVTGSTYVYVQVSPQNDSTVTQKVILGSNLPSSTGVYSDFAFKDLSNVTGVGTFTATSLVAGTLSSSGVLYFRSGSANEQHIWQTSNGTERARIDPTGDFQLPPAAKLEWSSAVATDTPDTNLYRANPSTLKSDGNLHLGGYLVVNDGQASPLGLGHVGAGAGGAGINFGTGSDTNLYRSAPNTLKTDDTFLVGTRTVFNPTSGASDFAFNDKSNLSVGYAFSAYKSTAQTGIPTGQWTKLFWQNTRFNVGNAFKVYDAANIPNTSRFVSAKAGYYRFSATALPDVNTRIIVALRKYSSGGTMTEEYRLSDLPGTGANHIGAAGSALVLLAVGEYVEIWVNMNTAGGQISALPDLTWFCGEFVGS